MEKLKNEGKDYFYQILSTDNDTERLLSKKFRQTAKLYGKKVVEISAS